MKTNSESAAMTHSTTDVPERAASVEGPSPTRLAQSKIMMIDDDMLMCEVVLTYLEEGGYPNVITTSDPSTALETMRKEDPDLLLLDLIMPQVSGFDILAAVRADDELKYLPVIVLTAATESSNKLKALELGASEFLLKPVDKGELILRVRNSLAFKVYQDYLTHADIVTGLPNRRVFMRRVTGAIARSAFDRTTFAVLQIGLDRFKQINETLSHQTGDEVLKATAERLNGSLRGGDLIARGADRNGEILARIGGDEFTVFLPNLASGHNAELVARRALKSIARPLEIGGRELFLTASAGISVFPGDGEDAETLLNSAASAMRQAKQDGRNRSEFYRKELNQVSLERLELEHQLHRAIERDELLLHYQPKVHVNTGRIIGAEALLRWQNPQLGLVPPLKFVPIAEECGLIVPIGDWVIGEGCRQAAAWARAGFPLPISVNVSSHQLTGRHIVDVVKQALSKTQLESSSLVLEVTESMLMKDLEASIELLNSLKALGAKLSIDDFGTGFSSLSYLKRFPLDELKIDRSFVSDIPADKTDLAIVRATIALAAALELRVVAEGVETEVQLQPLRELGCHAYQGYLCSPPVPAAEFEALLRMQSEKADPH